QAEDGIRDFHVTGVQTCALPISTCPYLLRRFKRDLALVGLSNSTCWEVPIPGEGQAIIAVREEDKREEQRKLYLEEFVYEAERRSEERRVGKECRSGW